MRRLKILLGALMLLGVVGGGSVDVMASSDSGSGGTKEGEFYDICNDATIDPELQKQAGCDEIKDAKEGEAATKVGQRIMNVAIGITAILAIISMVVGGVQMALSLGDPGKVNKGKAAVFYGAVALLIASLAAVIVNFVIGALFS